MVYELSTGEKMLVEAKGGKGVQLRPLMDYDRHNPFRFAVGVIRLPLSEDQKEYAQIYLDEHIAKGTEYDARGATSFNRMLRNTRLRRGRMLHKKNELYCSELVRNAVKMALPIDMRHRLVAPQDFAWLGECVVGWRY